MNIFTPKLSLKVETDILSKLALFLKANLSVSEALSIIETQVSVKKQIETLRVWRENVENGKNLAQAFDDERALVVRRITRDIVSLGEHSGYLADCLERACEQNTRILETKKKIIGAAVYPAMIFIGTIVLVMALLLFIFPKIIPLFKTFKVDLPLTTRALIWVYEFFSEHWTWILGGSILFVATTCSLHVFVEGFRNLIKFVLLRIPVIGKIIQIKILGSIFDSLVTLIRGGEALDTALAHTAQSVSFPEYAALFYEAGARVSNGKLFSDYARERKKHIPVFAAGIVAVGERTGNVESSFVSIADIFKSELDSKLKLLTSTIEPILMVSMSALIGFVALSIILPIYGITTHFQGN